MKMRLAGILIALLVATAPVAAQDATPKPAPNPATTPKPVAKKTTVKPGAAKSSDDPDAPVDVINPASQATLRAAGWQVIDDPATGVRLGLPGALVPKLAASRMGSRWTSKQGQIDIETFRLHEAALPALFEDEKKTRRRTVEHSTLKPDSFVMSGMQGLKRFVELVQASGNELRGVTIMFDQATEGMMGPISATMAGSFQAFPDRSANPPPGLKRGIEYSTAIVVSDRGDLLASAQATDQCQSITVPGLGHAERMAVEGGSDLALLRLYGAHNLTPVPLSAVNAGDNVTLVGIADPLAQAGAANVTRVQTRVTPQGLDPSPKPGFCGASAIDGQGQLVGMVNLKWLTVAANASTPSPSTSNVSQGVSQATPAAATPAPASPLPVASPPTTVSQATLVSAETIRTFLTVHGVAPAIAPAAADQSVLRVICVRK